MILRTLLLSCVVWLVPAWSEARLVFAQQAVETNLAATEREVTLRFPFRNDGGQPVKIKSISSACNCTIPNLEKRDYAPGESGEITVRFEAGSRHGEQKKAVIVATDDPALPEIVLSLTIAIPTVMEFSRPWLQWKEGESFETKTLVITTPAGLGVKELRARPTNPNPQFAIAIERVAPSEFHLHITPRARHLSEPLYVDAVLESGQTKRSGTYVRVR